MPASKRRHYLGKHEVSEYIEARRGLESDFLTQRLRRLVSDNSSILELGSGSGNDAAFLRRYFNLTCSDYSPHFVNHLISEFPNNEVIRIKAQTIETSETFDCVFSNKVLHHLSIKELGASLARQKQVVRNGGLVFHSFWLGTERTTSKGINFFQYTVAEIRALFDVHFKPIEVESYGEMNANDSAYIACLNL